MFIEAGGTPVTLELLRLGRLFFLFWLLQVSIIACGLFSSCKRAQLPHDIWDISSLTRDRTCVPCIRRRILNHWTTREAPREDSSIWPSSLLLIQGQQEALRSFKGCSSRSKDRRQGSSAKISSGAALSGVLGSPTDWGVAWAQSRRKAGVQTSCNGSQVKCGIQTFHY